MARLTAKKKARPRDGALLSFDDLPGVFFFGARGRFADVDELLRQVARVEASTGAKIHVMDAAAVCGPAHLATALLHARRSHGQGRPRARDIKVEAMLYLSGHRQITKAFEVVGVSKATAGLAIAIEGSREAAVRAAEEIESVLGVERDDRLLSPSAAKLKRLGVAGVPAKAADFEALAMETVALLDLE